MTTENNVETTETTETIREQITRVLTTSEFGRNCIKTVAQLKGVSEEEAQNILVEESVKQEEEYLARANEPELSLHMHPKMGMLLARLLGYTKPETVRDCNFTQEEARALYRLYGQLCNSLVDGGTIMPNGDVIPREEDPEVTFEDLGPATTNTAN